MKWTYYPLIAVSASLFVFAGSWYDSASSVQAAGIFGEIDYEEYREYEKSAEEAENEPGQDAEERREYEEDAGEAYGEYVNERNEEGVCPGPPTHND